MGIEEKQENNCYLHQNMLYSLPMALSNYNDGFLSAGETEDDGGLTPAWDDNKAWR